jgi:hypothetical protein
MLNFIRRIWNNNDVVPAADINRWENGIEQVTNAVNGLTNHTHNANDINAGTLNIARIPTGTTATTVALGNHTHAIEDSGWINLPSHDESTIAFMAYRRLNGVVYLRGELSFNAPQGSSVVTTQFATMPNGFRPNATARISLFNGSSAINAHPHLVSFALNINPAGAVSRTSAGSGSHTFAVSSVITGNYPIG